MRFYLGTHMLAWLWREQFVGVPLFVSHRRLCRRKTPYPRAVTAYAVDSGAFTELDLHGAWVETPESYVADLRRYAAELGPFDFAGQQDYICAPAVLERCSAVAGRPVSVAEHQAATVDNYLRLVELAPELPIVPTLQGATYEDYLACKQRFEAAGVDLVGAPLVGVGSLVGRPVEFVERLLTKLAAHGLGRIHAFGVQRPGIAAAGHLMASSDSQTWSQQGRRRDPLPGCTHASCNNCPDYALMWREGVLAAVDAPRQLGFAV